MSYDTSEMSPEQLAEIRQKRQRSFIKLSGKSMARAKPYLDDVERNLFKINAGGIVATLALIGQAITKEVAIAAWC